jgi:hypothetical protein
MKILLALILSVLGAAGNGWAARWYVVSDPVNGTGKICYSTVSFDNACTANSNKTFANLESARAAGDTVELSGGASGATYAQTWTITKSVTVVASSATGHNGLVTWGPAASSAATILIYQCSNVTITGPMTIEGYASYGNGAILITGATCSNIVIDGLTVKNNYNFLTARGIYVSTTGAAGGGEIKNCTVINAAYDGSNLRASGITLNTAPGWYIHDNTIGSTTYRWRYGIFVGDSDNAIVARNNVNYCTIGAYPTGDGKGISVEGSSTGCSIRRNYVGNCYIGITPSGTAGGNDIDYNIVYAATVNGINHTATNVLLVRVRNNTVIHLPGGTAGHGLDQQTGTGYIMFRNNIGYGDSAQTGTNVYSVATALSSSVIDTDYNLYWALSGMKMSCKDSTTCYNQGNLAGWQADIATDVRFTPGKDVHTLNSDPLFTNYAGGVYTLTRSSPARNAGDNSVWAGTANVVDYAGNAITDASGNIVANGGTVDIGAYEYSSTSTKRNINILRYLLW